MWRTLSVGQPPRSARDLQDPLFPQGNQPCPGPNRPTWTSAAGLESCPTMHHKSCGHLATRLVSVGGRRKLGCHFPACIQKLHYLRSVRIDPEAKAIVAILIH